MKKNAYTILGISQDADNNMIVRAQIEAMKKRQFSPKEIAEAKVQLSKPSSRLAVDFTFPLFEDFSQIKVIKLTKKSKGMNLNNVDVNKYKSI